LLLGSIGCALPIQAHEEEIRRIAYDEVSDTSIMYCHSWVKKAAVFDLRPLARIVGVPTFDLLLARRDILFWRLLSLTWLVES